MTEPESIEQARRRYHAAAHAMQSGVALDHAQGSRDGEPKHLRVGINSCLADLSGVAALLIEKGIITEAEYCTAMADAMEREKAAYEARLGVKLA